jgi:anti-sigma factor RsiW
MSSVSRLPGRCPIDIDETAEAYIMGRLSPTETLHFENHFMACRRCATAAEEAAWFVRAMKAATEGRRERNGVVRTGPT